MTRFPDLEPTPFDGPPLMLGTIRGYRRWIVVPDTGTLLSVSDRGYAWQPGENRARCRESMLTRMDPDVLAILNLRPPQGHPPGSPNCTCGFYAYHSRTFNAPLSMPSTAPVAGIIEAYGSLTLGTLGFRAEKARIVALCLPRPTPVRFVNSALAVLASAFVAVFLERHLPLPALYLFIPAVPAAVISYLLCHAAFARLFWTGDVQDRIRERYPGVRVYRSSLWMRIREFWPYRRAIRELLT